LDRVQRAAPAVTSPVRRAAPPDPPRRQVSRPGRQVPPVWACGRPREPRRPVRYAPPPGGWARDRAAEGRPHPGSGGVGAGPVGSALGPLAGPVVGLGAPVVPGGCWRCRVALLPPARLSRL